MLFVGGLIHPARADRIAIAEFKKLTSQNCVRLGFHGAFSSRQRAGMGLTPRGSQRTRWPGASRLAGAEGEMVQACGCSRLSTTGAARRQQASPQPWSWGGWSAHAGSMRLPPGMLDLLEVPNRAWPCEGSPWRPLPFASSPGSERLPPVQGTDTELLLHRPCFCWC